MNISISVLLLSYIIPEINISLPFLKIKTLFKQFDGEAPEMLELCGMQSIHLLPSLQGPLWYGVVASDRVLPMSQIELNCVLMLN